MGRDKNTRVIDHDTGLDAETESTLMEMHNAAAAHSHEISMKWGGGQPYERERAIREARFFMAQSVQAMIEFGARLIEIKENEPHGAFVEILTNRLGLNYRAAARAMQATIRVRSLPPKVSTSALLDLDKSKFLELMTMDDEPLEALAEGGTVAGLTLDEVDKMSVSQLRAALREARENEEAAGRVLEEKNRRLDDLATKLTKAERKKAVELETITPDQIRRDLEQTAHMRAFDADAQIRGNLRIALEALHHHATTTGASAQQFIASELARIERSVLELREAFGCYGTGEEGHTDEVEELLRLREWAPEDYEKYIAGAAEQLGISVAEYKSARGLA